MRNSLRLNGSLVGLVVGLVFVLVVLGSQAWAQSPGKGITLRVASPPYLEEDFQKEVVLIGLEQMGYKVGPKIPLDGGPNFILAVSQGDADFFCNYWEPLHDPSYEKLGGGQKMLKVGVLIRECLQGLLIDKKTADKHGIKTIGQFKDPNIAKLFDNNGDGKADLIGGSPGWGSTKTLDHQLKVFGLEKTVTHHQGTYFAMIADTIKRFESGNPVFYYSWTPMWINSIVVPGKDVVWLEMPGATEVDGKPIDTSVTGGRNFGYPANNVRVCANMKFLDANPAAKRFIELVTIPLNDVSAQNLSMHKGEDKPADVRRHAEQWVANHKAEFDGWVKEALKAAK